MPILECEDLRKTFADGFEAVRGITFDIEEGEAFGLLGPNLITADRALMSSHWDWHAIGGAVLTSLIVGAVTMPLATRAFRRAVSS